MYNNFKYLVEYSENGHHDCEKYGCSEEGICRCYTINSVIIKKIDLEEISNRIFDDIFNKNILSSKEYKRDDNISKIISNTNIGSEEIDKYCINRILHINKIYNKDNWNIMWSHSYYGDEVDVVEILPDLYDKIKEEAIEVISRNTVSEKIEFILKKEYGYVLDSISNSTYNIETVDIDKIFFPQKEHLKKVLNDRVYYDDSNTIKGICIKEKDIYRVVDGYHRLSSTQRKKIKIITC